MQTSDSTQAEPLAMLNDEVKPQDHRAWQVGDLISVGPFPERRVVIGFYGRLLFVMAESGWWNMYEPDSQLKLRFLGKTGLQYDYAGREQAHRDYRNGRFANFFQPLDHE